jgi:hypothetical protein
MDDDMAAGARWEADDLAALTAELSTSLRWGVAPSLGQDGASAPPDQERTAG